jgi:hypothetical protein
MKYMDRVIFGSILLTSLGFSSAATAACSTAEWSSVDLTAPSVADSPPATSRYSEFCSLSISDGSYVQSNFASDSHYFGRFYVFPKEVSGDGTADIFVAYTDEAAAPGDTLFKVGFDGADAIFTFGAENPVNETLPPGWSLIEFEYDDVGNVFNYWVNSVWDFAGLNYPDGVTGSIALPDVESGVVEAVKLGAPNGLGTLTGTFYFDAYEAHRTTNVGGLIDCDADGSGDPDININDILAVIDERFGAPQVLAAGQPDCTMDGDVNLNDILATIDVAF